MSISSPNDQTEFFSLRNSLDKLNKCNNEKGIKIEEMIRNFESFLDSSQAYLESTKKYPNECPHTIFDTVLKYQNLYNQKSSILIQALRVINLSYDPTNKVQNFNIDKMKGLFHFLIFSDEINNENVQKEISSFFITITKNQYSIKEFLSKNGLFLNILDLILKNDKDNDEWIFKTFMKKIERNTFDSKNSVDFCIYYSQIDSNSKKLNFLITFFLNFYSKFESCKIFSNIAMEKGAFDKYIYFVSKIDSKSWSGYYEPFIYDNNATNNSFIKALFNSCLKIPSIQEQVFKTISEIYLTTSNLNKDLNSNFPLKRIILDFQLPLDKIIEFLLKLDKYQPKFIQFCLEPFFIKVTACQKNDKCFSSDPKKLYNSLLTIVYHQLELKIFNEEKLISIGFIETFVTSLNSDILAYLIGQYKNFTQLVYNIVSILLTKQNMMINNVFLTEEIFKAIIKTYLFCNEIDIHTQLNNFCCNFIGLSTSENNMRTLLNFMLENKTLCLLTVLLSTIQDFKIGKSFIKSNGLEWLEKALQINLISIEKYSMLLGHLVCNQRFEEVDSHFLELQEKQYFGKVNKSEIHPLFVSNIEYLKQIVYGMNKSENKPIRVYSLYHFLEIPKDIDPYNAWMLGKYSMNLLINRIKQSNKENTIYDIPLIKVIGNRYLNPEHVDILLKSNPYNIQQFCDKDNYDHFPLYQFYRGNNDLVIKQPFTGISFWFKFTGEIKQYCSFFSINHISFSIRNQNELVIYYLPSPIETIPKITFPVKGQEDKILAMVEINPYDWNIVYIQKVDHFRSSTISIFINHYNRVNNYPHSKPLLETKVSTNIKFQMASFRRFSGGLMFLGPSIRFFGQFDKNSIQHADLFKLIRNCGPGYTNKLKNASNIYLDSSSDIYNTNNLATKINVNNETIYLATEINLYKKNVLVPSNCFLVPYFGFPYHFTSIQKMSTTLFQFLRKSQTKDDFINVLFSITSINSITKVNSRMFWSILLDILHEISSKNPSFITPQIINILIKEIAYQKVYKYNNTILTRLFYNLKIWNSVDKEDLIKTIFDYFHDIDINAAIPDFSYFLSDLILKNPTNKEIILTILNYYEKVPNAISNIANFLLMESPQVFNKKEEGDLILYNNIQSNSKNFDAKFMIQLKDTIISSISEYLRKSTVNVVKKFFPFNDLNIFLFNYLTNSKDNEELSCKILHLIFKISIKDPSYFEISPFLMINAICLSYNKMILQDAFKLICKSPIIPPIDQKPENNYCNYNAIYLLLALAWSSFVLISHVELFKLENLIKNIRFQVENCINSFEFCLKYTSYIVNSKECLMLLSVWFPAAFKSILTIKDILKENESKNDENNKCENWKDVYYFNNQNKEKIIIDYLIGQILDNFHIPIQNHKDINDAKCIFNENLYSKKIIDIYTRLMLEIIFKIQPNSQKITTTSSFTFLLFSSNETSKTEIQLFNQLFSSLALCSPFIDDLWIKNQSLDSISLFINILLEKPNKNFCFIGRFFKYLGFILGHTTNGIEIIEKLLSNSFFIDHYPKEVDSILFQIFKKATNEEIKKCCDIFSKYQKKFMKVVQSTKCTIDNIEYNGSIGWAYLFYTKLHKSNNYKHNIVFFNLIPSNDRAKFEQWLQNNNNDKDNDNDNQSYSKTMEKSYQGKTLLIQKNDEEISNKKTEMKNKYLEYTKILKGDMEISFNRYTSKLFRNNKEIEDQIKSLEISLFLFYEEKNWNNFMNEIKLKSSILTLFNPSSYLISSQCLPYQFPKILKPCISMNQNFVEVFEKKFTINFEMDALKNIKTIKMKQSASLSLNNLVDEINSTILNDKEENNKNKLDVFNCFKKHFEIQYGKIQYFFNCYIELYDILFVPSVLFIFANSTMMLLTYAEIAIYETQNKTKSYAIKLLNDQTKETDFQQFITFVFNQQFGKTTLFFSHVVINLPITDIIKIRINIGSQTKNNLYILIWTFSSGHFVLSIKSHNFEEIRNIFEKSPEIKYLNNFTEKSIPDLFLFRIKSTDDAIKNWINRTITNKELIFYLNGIKGCSFVSFSIFPEFPCVGKWEGKNAYQSTMINYFNSFITEKISHKKDNVPINEIDDQESYSIAEFHQEEFILNIYDIRSFLEKRFNLLNIQQQSRKERKFIADFNSIHVYQLINPKSIFSIKMNQIDKIKLNEKNIYKISNFNSKRINFVDGYLFYLSELEALLPNDYIIRINRESMILQIIKINPEGSSSSETQLSIRNNVNKNLSYSEIYCKFDQIFSTARQINTSKNGLYIVVDFEIGMSRVYRIFYSNNEGTSKIWKPIKIVIACETLLDNYNADDRNRRCGCCSSCISDSYSIAATRHEKDKIVMWCVQPIESTLCLPLSSEEAPKSQTFWATPASIHRIIKINDNHTNINETNKEEMNKEETNEKETNEEEMNKEEMNKEETNEKETNEEEMNKEEMNKEETNEKEMNKEETNKKEMNKEEMNKEEMNEEETNEKETNKEEMNKEEMNEEETNEKETNKEEINKNEVNNNDEIISFKLDEDEGLWISTRTRLLFYSLNAEKIAELQLSSIFSTSKPTSDENLLVTEIEVVSSPFNEPFAIIGFNHGQMILASPRFDINKIEYKTLNSPHKTQITSISINRMNKSGFVAVDSSKTVSYWSNIGSCSDEFSFKRLEKCAICKKNNAKYICSSCNLGICPNCFITSETNYNSKQSVINKCLVCSSIEHFFL